MITFPADISEATVWWFKNRLEKIDGLLLKTRSMTITKGTKTKPNCYAFHLSATYSGYLRGLESMQIPKPLREDLGGGMKEFTIKEVCIATFNLFFVLLNIFWTGFQLSIHWTNGGIFDQPRKTSHHFTSITFLKSWQRWCSGQTEIQRWWSHK